MPRKKWPIFLIAGIILCAVFGVVLAIYIGGSYVANSSAPVYAYGQSASAQSGYTRKTLTSEDTTYESDYAEYALNVTGADNSNLVGRVVEGGDIYAIPGQAPSAYVVLWEFMSPVGIFRNSNHPAFDWRTASFYEIRLSSLTIATATPPVSKDSVNSQLIQDVLTSLKDGEIVSPSQVSGDVESYALYLYSGELQGMNYCAGVYIDAAGRVYLAENTISQEWHLAGPLFSRWAKLP
jgi:hypothetical protein